MTENPRSHQYSDADWEHEIDSVQRGGTTAATKARRHGEVSCPDVDGKKPNDEHKEDNGGFDEDGIPVGI